MNVSTLRSLSTSVIYKYSCALCASEYIGSTSRTLKTRIAEHEGVSFRTGVPLSKPPHSSIRDHAEQCSGHVSKDSFSILSSSNSSDLRLLESIYIHKLKPKLNDMQSAYPITILK